MNKRTRFALASMASATFLATTAIAQPAAVVPVNPTPVLVQNFDPHGVHVPQSGPVADRIRANLALLKLPPGFKIDLYAVVPDAYRIAAAPGDYGVFVGTRKKTVWVIPDPEGEAKPEEVKAFAPSLQFDRPDGLCFTSDGYLVVVERNRIRTFSTMELFDGGDKVTRSRMLEVVPQGELLKTKDDPSNGARACRVGADKKLYVGLGGIIRLNPFLGTDREVYAQTAGSVGGMDWNPKDNSLWFTGEGPDGAGISRATAADHVESQVRAEARAANLGLAFYAMTRFPTKYRGGFFSVKHGSTGPGPQAEPQVLFTSLQPDGTADRTEVFLEGWRDAKTHRDRGRPVDVAPLFDGSLLVSDDLAGALYRITYDGP